MFPEIFRFFIIITIAASLLLAVLLLNMYRKKHYKQVVKRMIKNLHLYGIIVVIAFVSTIIATNIMMIATSNAYFVFFFYNFILIPILIIGFILFLFLQRNSLVRFVNMRNAGIVCIITAIIIITPAVNFTITTLPPPGLENTWWCDYGQALCTNDSCCYLRMIYDETYARKTGRFYDDNLTGKGKRTFEFEWRCDNMFSDVITILCTNNSDCPRRWWWSLDNETGEQVRERWNWEVKLIVDIVGDNKMVTYYVSDKNAPFNAELFDGITWTGVY